MEFRNETLKAIRKGVVEEREGYVFDYPLEDGTSIEMGVYQDGGTWRVIDVRTGLSLLSGTTREKAVANSSDETVRTRYAAMVKTDDYLDKMLRFKELCKGGYKTAEKSPESEIECGELNLKGECVCISGVLAGMTRQEAFIRLKRIGGTPSERFTGKTTVFVIGANSGREKKEKLDKAIAKGQEIRVVDGSTFVATLRKEEEQLEKPKKPVVAPKPVKAEKPKAPKPPIQTEPEKLSFKDMDAKAAEHCMEVIREVVKDGNVVVRWKGKELAPIRVEGDTRPFKEKLVELGLRWAGDKKFWYLSPER